MTVNEQILEEIAACEKLLIGIGEEWKAEEFRIWETFMRK